MARAEFSDRHIGPSGDEISTMLLELGYSDLESFTQAVLPDLRDDVLLLLRICVFLSS